jgi:protein-S-isoprenylcysteine O-methyltransferase Ste14
MKPSGTRNTAIVGTVLFLILVPGSLAVYVPWLITGWTTTSNISGTPHALPPSLSTRPTLLSLRTLGAVCIAAGIPILLDCFACFALRGLGTPAPIAPPRHLVVTHLYRYTRNPMYLAVSLLVFGQALLFLNLGLLEYGLIVCAGFIAFVHFYEEPNLRRKFGNEYEEYCRQVPRWIPRLRPYSLSRSTGSN